ncbi:sulfur reduction protein DsrE [Christiangramia sediminis]|uniref:Sulfur reduction protein DsrE n=1 Tax=Christiangramia sediminis TaxID=2881336 RepID=A0A9X1LHR2_9FLAO|nr:sulfur reduction protein DsrE [Christiangramia sediminis]MCB7480555.1 sulfur reduction protein DsrE [Christiangramia sediminis]
MKTILYSIILLTLTLFTGTKVNAQQVQDSKHNYVVLTKKVPQLQPILITAEKLKEEDGSNFGKFEIIICGKNIGDITDPAKMEKFITKAENLGVKLVACGFSMNKFKVDKKDVPGKMEIVENGILYNFQLQKKGYISLSL